MGEPTFMFRGELDIPRMVRQYRARGLPMRKVDVGYMVHSAVEQAFGPGVLRPFAVRERERGATVMAYTSQPAEALRQHAQTFADPADFDVWAWDGVATKLMPERFAVGRRLGFHVRACPIRRRSGAEPGAKGREVDAFLAECERVGDAPVDRDAVYVSWLSERLVRGGAALERAQVEEFSLRDVLRRTQGESRSPRFLRRPDVVFSGVLEVREPEAFRDLLRRGVGRHRAFGFGMLLLAPP